MNDPTLLPFKCIGMKGPEARLRFVEPDSPPPVEERSVWLKQCDLAGFGSDGRDIKRLFSSYFERWDRDVQSNVDRTKEELESLGSTPEVRPETRPNRRYAGDDSLPRARYYSVCESAEKGDKGTMARELGAYLDPINDGAVELTDLSSQQWIQQSRLFPYESETRPAIEVSVPPHTADQHEWLRDVAKRGRIARIRLPLRTTQERFRKLIDLRVPRTAAWFTRNLTRLEWLAETGPSPAFPHKAPLDDLGDLLPSLMAQTPGGGLGSTRIAGQWLRALGVDGLIFPSARSDASVEVHDGEVARSYGWNLVDYREALPPRQLCVDLTSAWATKVRHETDEPLMPLHEGIDLVVQPPGTGAGSWFYRNVEEANQTAYLVGCVLNAYGWARRGSTVAQEEALAMMMGATRPAGECLPVADCFLRSMLGEKRARQAVLGAGSDSLEPAEAALVDLPGTFAAMDARLRALSEGE